MQRIFFILIGIILGGHCLSCAYEPPATPESKVVTIADNFVIDNNWISVDLGSFEPHAINNSTQIAGDIISGKKGAFAGVWKQGFVEKLDGVLVTARSSAVAINDSGLVVGYQKGRYGNDYERAVLWNNGVMQELGTLSGIESRALAINNSGDVVGWVKTSYGVTDAFIWRSGTMEYLGILTSGIAINNNGQILGTIDGGNPVLWNNGIMQKLQPPGIEAFTPLGAKKELIDKTPNNTDKISNKPESAAYGLIPTCLNDAGQVLGHTNNFAFLWSDGELQYLYSNVKGRFLPLGMNKYGMITGKIDNRAVVWNRGNVTELNAYFKGLRGWKVTEARGINDHGQIIVYASDGTSGKSRAFLVTPKSNIPILIKGTEFAEVEQETPGTGRKKRQQSTGR